MVTVRRTTPLPISADTAFALAQKPATFAYVARGVLRVPALEGLEALEGVGAAGVGATRVGATGVGATGVDGGALAVPGARVSGRLWWLGVVPAWTHHLEVVAVERQRWELRTQERGGPIRVWNHRLAFAPTTGGGCTYTDEIVIEAGVLTWPTALFARLFFALRQARWRRLARVLS